MSGRRRAGRYYERRAGRALLAALGVRSKRKECDVLRRLVCVRFPTVTTPATGDLHFAIVTSEVIAVALPIEMKRAQLSAEPGASIAKERASVCEIALRMSSLRLFEHRTDTP